MTERQHVMTDEQLKELARVVTPKARLSYPHLFEPWAGVNPKPGQEPKYGCSLVFEPDIVVLPADLADMKKAVVAAGQLFWPNGRFEAMLKEGKLRMPFRDDWEKKGYKEGSIFINPRTSGKPGIVMPQAGADGKPIELTDTELIYAGCYVRASVTAFGYDNSGNLGVSFALNNLQWLEHGERLDNRRAASEEFDPIEEAPADLSGLDDSLEGML